ncbi:uncharacterized protein LOC121467577 isoform X1 [Drosophila elegans]|uniref:uncharacterized protein LOC121467577 isoform X1 n=1 Tax=Drosophila elegans TaxID=30023 RepID=UPI001BC860C5|nr:uncharacterized protein LOC121467577 isoform X1 [Drosophila elegans]
MRSSSRDSRMDTLGTCLRLRVCLCVFITFVDYAYKNYTSPRSQRRAPATTKDYKSSAKVIQPVAREITTELFLLWFVPLLFNGPEDHTQSHAIHIHHRSQKNPTQRYATQLDSTETRLLPPGTQNSVLLLKITLLLFIYVFLHFLLLTHSHPVSIFICLLRLLSFNGARSLVIAVFVIVAPVVVSDKRVKLFYYLF